MPLLPKGFKALVIGSSGSIGSAFMALLSSQPNCSQVMGLHRGSEVPIDYDDPDSIETALAFVGRVGPFHLIINTIGMLHSQDWMPEKRLADVSAEQMIAFMKINTIGPALTLKHGSTLLSSEGSVFVTLSARVGSIEDNRLGGWFSYRASKAALNMVIRTAAVELKRTHPKSALISLHPGTVVSKLTAPFAGQKNARRPMEAVQEMWTVIQGLGASDSGSFLSFDGQKIPW